MFRLSYVQGDNFKKSFFVAREGKDLKVVSADVLMPAEVKAAILSGKEAVVITPEEAAEQIHKQCGGSFRGFAEWLGKVAPAAARTASLERTAEWARNEGEISKVDLPKAGEVIRAINEKEAAEGLAATQLPNDRGSDVKKYYGRLPGKVVGETMQAINLQSNVKETYQLLKKAVEEEKAKREVAEEKAAVATEKVTQMEGDKKNEDKMKTIDGIVADLKKQGRVKEDEESENGIIDLLSKICDDDIGFVAELVSMTAKAKKGKGMGMEMEEGAETSEGLSMPSLPKGLDLGNMASLRGVNLPPQFEKVEEPMSGTEWLQKYWNAK